jgi:radical SAM protein with 4Fe4S-binding SPASM domain
MSVLQTRQKWSELKAVMGILHGGRVFGGPVQANLNLVNRCNLNCIHCFYFSPFLQRSGSRMLTRERPGELEAQDEAEIDRIVNQEADPGKTRVLMDELVSLGTRRFQFSGMGEIFLHRNTVELMQRAKAKGCYGVANTNGTLLNHEIIDEIIAMKFDRLRITTMAGTREMFRHTHPGANAELFDTLQETLLYLSDRKRATGVRWPKVVLSCTVIAHNHQDLADFASFAQAMGVDRIQFHPFDLVGDPGLATMALSPDQARSVRDQLSDVQRFLEAAGISHNIGNYLAASQEHLDTMALYEHIPCYYGWLAVRITVEGMLYPCARCFHSLGNVYESGFRRIWKGEAYRRFRSEALAINHRRTPVAGCDCRSCVHHHANLHVFELLHPIGGRHLMIRRHLSDQSAACHAA